MRWIKKSPHLDKFLENSNSLVTALVTHHTLAHEIWLLPFCCNEALFNFSSTTDAFLDSIFMRFSISRRKRFFFRQTLKVVWQLGTTIRASATQSKKFFLWYFFTSLSRASPRPNEIKSGDEKKWKSRRFFLYILEWFGFVCVVFMCENLTRVKKWAKERERATRYRADNRIMKDYGTQHDVIQLLSCLLIQ